jgi:hypothetical protein
MKMRELTDGTFEYEGTPEELAALRNLRQPAPLAVPTVIYVQPLPPLEPQPFVWPNNIRITLNGQPWVQCTCGNTGFTGQGCPIHGISICAAPMTLGGPAWFGEINNASCQQSLGLLAPSTTSVQ